jgi:putative acetyltransferase
MMTAEFEIAAALPEDAASLLKLQTRAVQAIKHGVYDSTIIEEWAGSLTTHHLEALTDRLRTGSEEALKVITAKEGLAGFGSIVPATSRLRTLYVDPAHSGRGIGTAILTGLIAKAERHGLTHLSLESSLNAVKFYQQHGFAIDREGTYALPSGASMRCVFMTRLIGGA